MGETKLCIDIKKRRLKNELLKEKKDKKIIYKLKKDIDRHIQWEKIRNKAKRKRWKNQK